MKQSQTYPPLYNDFRKRALTLYYLSDSQLVKEEMTRIMQHYNKQAAILPAQHAKLFLEVIQQDLQAYERNAPKRIYLSDNKKASIKAHSIVLCAVDAVLAKI